MLEQFPIAVRSAGQRRRLTPLVEMTVTSLLVLVGLAGWTSANADEPMFSNPILRGGYPDPSICRVDDDFYIVNSSFEYFPGLPIHHSTDLVNWKLVGYGLHRLEQVSDAVNLSDVQTKGGIHAPTLRCRDGRFYIITTNVYLPDGPNQETEFVNFVVTADSPEGPWSEPLVLEGAPGIDPDIFFDDDGRVWYVGTHSPKEPSFPGEGEIWLQEIDTGNWELVGERHFLWRGACGGIWSEGPHMYKKDGRYYLLIAEGGTSFNHAVMIAVSDDIRGPYTPNPRNPVLTSRHLSYDNWINSTGHADMVELSDGRWYMVALGIRNELERTSNMGRETNLIPMTWEREPFEWKEPKHLWPVAAPATGRVEQLNSLPFAETEQALTREFVDHFDARRLGLDWNFRRTPLADSYSLTERPGFLRLHALPETIQERGRTSRVGVRQQETEFRFSTRMLFAPTSNGSEAGLNLFQKDNQYLSFTVIRERDEYYLKLVLAQAGEDPVTIRRTPLHDFNGAITLQARASKDQYRFAYAIGADSQDFAATAGNHLLARDNYTGAYLGLYATANGARTSDYADFDWARQVYASDDR